MKIALVLSGGGVRGVAHLAVIKCLEEWNIPVHLIAGTSAGALVGAFYAHQYEVRKILEITKQINLFDWKSITIGSLGLLKMQTIEKTLKHYLPDTFEALSIPLHVCATDIINNKTVFFHSGPLVPALLASACIPILYEPVSFNQSYYVDGGVLNNLPIEAINQYNKIIAVHVNQLAQNKTKLSFKDIVEKSFHLSISQSVYAKKDKCHVFIDIPDMSRYSMFDIKYADDIFHHAFQYMQTQKDMLLSSLNT